jgi:16S rRNA (guanine527-N7)-methyltransferase
MGQDVDMGTGQTEAVDEARVVEGIAGHPVGRLDQRRQDPDVELEAAREQHCGLGPGEVGKSGLDPAMLREISADKARGRRTAGWMCQLGEARVVGQAEVVVAAKTNDRLTLEPVVDADPIGDDGRATGEARLLERIQSKAEAAVEGGRHGALLTGFCGCCSYCGSVAMSKDRSLRELLAAQVEALGLPIALPWERLEQLAEQWLRFGRVMNLSGAKDLPALAEQMGEALQVVTLASRLGCSAGQRWIDVGSGAGFPGLIVAACLPVEVVLVEPRERRASFLDLMLGQMGGKGRVVRGRLEVGGVKVSGRRDAGLGRFEWASARAVFSPQAWLDAAGVVVAEGGVVVAHLHRGDLDPVGWVAAATVEGLRWSVRGYRVQG